MHNLLKRQLKRYFGDSSLLTEEMKSFISAVNDTYFEFDTDRAMLERSLELSSNELLQANSEMRAIFQAIPDLLFRLDENGVILDYKAGGMTEFIAQPKDLIGKKIQNVPDKNVSNIFAKSIHEVEATNSIVSFEYSLVVHGIASFYEARLIPLPEKQMIAMIQNITKRKQVEEALKESERFLRTTINVMSDIVCFKDGNGRWKLANDYDLKLFQLEGVDYIGKKDSELAEYSDFYRDAFLNCEATDEITWEMGVKSRCDEIIPQPDGTEMIFDVVKIPTYTPDGERKGLIIVGRDITERKKTEKELLQLSQAVRQSPASIIILNTEGYIEYVNPRFTEVTGYSLEEVVGKDSEFYLIGDKTSQDRELLRNTILLGNEWRGEFLNRKKDGSSFWESATISPIKDKNGEVTRILAIREDITEKKALEINLKKALDKSKESDRLKSSLLANMSHEFRTPINGILGICSILKDMSVEQEKKDMLDLVIASSKRLMSTLHSILELADLESDNDRRAHSFINISELVMKLNDNFKTQAERKGISFVTEIRCNDLLVKASNKDISHIITHLLDNALKFTDRGSIGIIIESEVIDQRLFAKLIINDTGIGIAPEYSSIIFDEFRQVSEGISRNYEGSGVGLSLVKRIIALLNGKIYVKSEVSKGSEFTVYLPAEKGNQSVMETEEVRNNFKELSAPKVLAAIPEVLVVEDNLLNRKVIELYLNGICKVDEAENGLSAIKLAKEKRYELILMDINLGHGIDGISTAKEIRKLSWYQNVPMVAVTGYAMETDKNEILSQGLTHFLVKPFEKGDLLKLVTDILHDRGYKIP
ncbi:MAG: PAS domain S-box protein [Bacteroidota bacterium]|nr:PAS domain S-box protein [Bacteroidota bacterium]